MKTPREMYDLIFRMLEDVAEDDRIKDRDTDDEMKDIKFFGIGE